MRRLILHHFYRASIRKAWVHTLSTRGGEKNDAKLTAVCIRYFQILAQLGQAYRLMMRLSRQMDGHLGLSQTKHDFLRQNARVIL
jgi:hypothetical protein